MWEKEKLLVMSNFFFSHRVFNRLELQTQKNQGLSGEGLKAFFYLVANPQGAKLKKNFFLSIKDSNKPDIIVGSVDQR